MGWLVGVWLLPLLRAPGEWMIPKTCLFPPGLIASGFVNGKITSSLALAGGESSRLIQYLRKLHCRAREAGGRNRLPVSVSAAGDDLCRHQLASAELTGKTSPLPRQPGKYGIFSGLAFPGGSRGVSGQPRAGVVFGCVWVALGPAAPALRGGMGSFHRDPAAFPALPWLLEGEWDLLAVTLHLPAFGCWRWAREPAAPGEGSTGDVRSRFTEARWNPRAPSHRSNGAA